MTIVNTIKDITRILREQPERAEAIRSLILSKELLELPARFDRFAGDQHEFNQTQRQFNKEQHEFNQAQREFNQEQKEFNRLFAQRLNSIEGTPGNLNGGQYEQKASTKALAYCTNELEFSGAYIAFTQYGNAGQRMTGNIEQAVKDSRITREQSSELYRVVDDFETSEPKRLREKTLKQGKQQRRSRTHEGQGQRQADKAAQRESV